MPTSVLPTYITTAARRVCSPLHKSAKPFNFRGNTAVRFSHFETSPPHTRNKMRSWLQRYFGGLSRNTLLFAIASLFSDISTEMLYPVLPVFLAQTLNATKTKVGLGDAWTQAML